LAFHLPSMETVWFQLTIPKSRLIFSWIFISITNIKEESKEE
jgi:hypothetical protein